MRLNLGSEVTISQLYLGPKYVKNISSRSLKKYVHHLLFLIEKQAETIG